jgi:hypothetical protein
MLEVVEGIIIALLGGIIVTHLSTADVDVRRKEFAVYTVLNSAIIGVGYAMFVAVAVSVGGLAGMIAGAIIGMITVTSLAAMNIILQGFFGSLYATREVEDYKRP